MAAFFVACGLDENGTAPDGSTLDASNADVRDVTPQDTFVAPTCQTIDAACLGVAVPSGWVLMDISDSGASACPGDLEDWEPHLYITNPTPTSTACTCGGCAVDGGYSCNGTVDITGGAGAQCNDHDAAINGGTAQCVSMNEIIAACIQNASTSVGVTMPAPSGTPSCNSPSTGTKLASITNMLGCKPQQCSTDYCGMHAQGFETCILHNNDPSGVCPAGYRNAFGTSALASAPGNYVVNCAGCPCQMGSAGACTGTVRVFAGLTPGGDSCDGDGSVQGVHYVETLDAAPCQLTGVCAFNSLYYVPNAPPPASCSPSAPTAGSGDAGLTNPVTICCAGP